MKKEHAHGQVAKAIALRTLTKQPCEVCDNPKAIAHHDDYDKPLDVRWLCRPHHAEAHGMTVQRISLTPKSLIPAWLQSAKEAATTANYDALSAIETLAKFKVKKTAIQAATGLSHKTITELAKGSVTNPDLINYWLSFVSGLEA